MFINANALNLPIASNTVQTIVTSPPYFGLRDYGIKNQIGLESSIDDYVNNLVSVFRECWRVLRNDGIMWVNLGDSYYSNPGNGRGGGSTLDGGKPHLTGSPRVNSCNGLKPKDLIGIPWRVAFALQADGWYLRSDIIWHKPNPMPESVTDRPTKAHEYLFMLTKNSRYYYDADAAMERSTQNGKPHPTGRKISPDRNDQDAAGKTLGDGISRNARSVWTIATQPTPFAHFATMPERLVEPCILAGSRPGDLVFDPFTGSGTVAKVAIRLGRQFVGTELNYKYIHDIVPQRMKNIQMVLA